MEIRDNEEKLNNLEKELMQTSTTVEQLTTDNANRRDLLDQTNASLTELGNMLTDMKHSTDKLRQLFWD